MAGVARQSHMGKVPLAPSFLLLIFPLSALCSSKVRGFHSPCRFRRFGFVWYSGSHLVSTRFCLCRITQIATPPHNGPIRFPLGLGLQKKSQNRTHGQHGLHAGITGPSPLRHLLPIPGTGSQGTQGTQKLRAQFLRHLRHLRHWLVVQHLHQPLSVTAVAAEGRSQLPKLFPPTVHQLF